ncbi:MAG: DsrE family protein [Solirubrobacteraceae bacterium]
MSDNRKVIVGCTHGQEDPDRVAVAYLTAVAALEQGKDVLMWLTVEGVQLAVSGYAQRIRVDKDPPVERLHRQFIERGGRMYACPICFNERQLDQAELVDCAELKGATKLLEFAGNNAMTFTY